MAAASQYKDAASLALRFRPLRRTAQRLRRMAEDANEAQAHPFGVHKSDSLGDRFERLPAVLHPWTGGLNPQALNRLGRRHASAGHEGPAELPDAQVRRFGQPLDR
jgi:hypothetical protein